MERNMDELIREMYQKGLIEIVRKPRSEELAELIRSTKAMPGDWLHWLDYAKAVRN